MRPRQTVVGKVPGKSAKVEGQVIRGGGNDGER